MSAEPRGRDVLDLAAIRVRLNTEGSLARATSSLTIIPLLIAEVEALRAARSPELTVHIDSFIDSPRPRLTRVSPEGASTEPEGFVPEMLALNKEMADALGNHAPTVTPASEPERERLAKIADREAIKSQDIVDGMAGEGIENPYHARLADDWRTIAAILRGPSRVTET